MHSLNTGYGVSRWIYANNTMLTSSSTRLSITLTRAWSLLVSKQDVQMCWVVRLLTKRFVNNARTGSFSSFMGVHSTSIWCPWSFQKTFCPKQVWLVASSKFDDQFEAFELTIKHNYIFEKWKTKEKIKLFIKQNFDDGCRISVNISL